MGIWKNEFKFVGLQMSNEVPFYIIREHLAFGRKLLWPVLAE